MRKLFYTTACIWLICLSCGLSQNVEWVKLITGSINNIDLGHIFISVNGAILFSQAFTPDTLLTIDDQIINPNNYGVTEFFVSNVKNNGTIGNIKIPQSRKKHTLNGLVVDGDMNSFIIGEYNNLAIFDSIILDKSGQTKGFGMFLMKLDSSLKVKWAYPISYYNNGSFGTAQGKAITIDESSLYFAGLCSGGVIANNDTLNSTAFIIKSDLEGNNKWVKKIYGNLGSSQLFNYGMRLSNDKKKGLLFASNISYKGAIIIDSVKLISKENDILISLFDTLGNLVWTKILGGEKTEIMSDVKLINETVYVSGFTSGDMYMNGERVFKNSSTFVIALNAGNGEKKWIKDYGKYCGYPNLAVSKNNLFVSVEFWDTVLSNRKYIPFKNEKDTYSADILIEQINSSGDVLFSFKIGNKGSERFPIVGLDSLNHLYLICNFVGVPDILGISFDAHYGSFLAKIKLPTLSVNLEDKNNLQVLESEEFVKIKMPAKPHKSLLSCFNSIGDKLFTKDILPLTDFIELSKSTFNNGKYFCTIEHDGITETISFVINK